MYTYYIISFSCIYAYIPYYIFSMYLCIHTILYSFHVSVYTYYIISIPCICVYMVHHTYSMYLCIYVLFHTYPYVCVYVLFHTYSMCTTWNLCKFMRISLLGVSVYMCDIIPIPCIYAYVL